MSISENFEVEQQKSAKGLCFSLLAPWQGPDVLIVQDLSATILMVRWSHLQVDLFRGKTIGYKITYYPAHLERNITFASVNYTTNTTTLTNLTVYTMYVVNVSAVSSGGIGPANTAKARTGTGGYMFSLIEFPLRFLK